MPVVSTPPLKPSSLPSLMPEAQTLQIVRLFPTVNLPIRAYEASAAFDLSAHLIGSNGRNRTVTLGPGITQLVPTGLAMRPPKGYCILVCSRSGLSMNGVFVANAPGIVDPDYTGEISVILTNNGLSTQYVKHGDRVGQVLIIPYITPSLLEVEHLPATERGEKGFGSTGA